MQPDKPRETAYFSEIIDRWLKALPLIQINLEWDRDIEQEKQRIIDGRKDV